MSERSERNLGSRSSEFRAHEAATEIAPFRARNPIQRELGRRAARLPLATIFRRYAAGTLFLVQVHRLYGHVPMCQQYFEPPLFFTL